MKASEIQRRVTELFGDRVLAFTKNDDRLFKTSDHEVTDIFWLYYRREKKYVQVAIPLRLLESPEENWLTGWNERIDYLFSRVTGAPVA